MYLCILRSDYTDLQSILISYKETIYIEVYIKIIQVAFKKLKSHISKAIHNTFPFLYYLKTFLFKNMSLFQFWI